MREGYLLNASATLLERYQASSLHLTFLTRQEWERAGKTGLLRRTDQQFHWFNQGYGSFEDFTASLTSRKRKLIKRERRAACSEDITIRLLTGSDLTEGHWDAFFAFYTDTGARKWGQPYLTREFFSLVGQTMAENILLILCERAGQPIAGALNFIGGDALYGRYWGCLEDHPFLHFEACYYQAIEYAISHGLDRVEAGAQGQHKLARGYLPQTTYSAHLIADPSLRSAVESFLIRERTHVEMENRELARFAPYRKSDGKTPKNDA
jgi:predicted N-acyltransferase